MASVPQVTLDRVDLAVCAVADALLRRSASSDDVDSHASLVDLTLAFRQFAEGVAILIGPVPDGTVVAEHSAVEHL